MTNLLNPEKQCFLRRLKGFTLIFSFQILGRAKVPTVMIIDVPSMLSISCTP